MHPEFTSRNSDLFSNNCKFIKNVRKNCEIKLKFTFFFFFYSVVEIGFHTKLTLNMSSNNRDASLQMIIKGRSAEAACVCRLVTDPRNTRPDAHV